MQRSHFFQIFRTLASIILLASASAALVPGNSLADPADNVVVRPKPSQGSTQPQIETNALFACIAATEPAARESDFSGVAEQLRKPDNRIEGQDWSGQDLSGKNFRGKVLVRVKLRGARLRGADLTEAIICDSDLTEADLSGAHLDRALIGGGTELKDANLMNASGRALKIADAHGWGIRIDGADLRGARLVCEEESVRCWVGAEVDFTSVTGADLRGATIDHLWNSPPSLGATHLDQVTTHLDGAVDLDLVQLANGVGDSGRITFIPSYGYLGVKTEFAGMELRQLAAVLSQMQPASAHPSFDCARARTSIEKAICTDPKLAALDSALSWLWKRVEHTSEQTASQKKWAATRATCLDRNSSASSSNLKGCIELAYAERIRQLGPKSSPPTVGSGTYTTDSPLELPQGQYSALVSKFLMARGYRQDEIAVEDLGNGTGKVSGEGVWGNGHLCGFEASEAQTQRTGSIFRINDYPAAPDERYSVSFVITPQVVILAGGDKQFQCGARGGWSDVYFRQPDGLVAKVRSPSP